MSEIMGVETWRQNPTEESLLQRFTGAKCGNEPTRTSLVESTSWGETINIHKCTRTFRW